MVIKQYGIGINTFYVSHIDQWNEIKNPKRNTHVYDQYFRKLPRIHNEERIDPSIKGA